MATTHLTRTTSGTPTSSKKCTFSTWIKFSETPQGSGSDRWIFGEHDNNSNHSYLYLRNSSAIGWYETSSGAILSKITTRLFRDLNSWYHIQVIMDGTDSTAEDRWKLYVNGERITSWATNSPSSYSSGYSPRVNLTGKNIYIGGVPSYQTHFNGLMSHTHFCDGTALAPTVFGSTDSTTGEWKINASPSFTPGNNGFTILKDGNTITDQSDNSNNFSLGAGTLTKSEDNPSNVFATLNPLSSGTDQAFSKGNNEIANSTTNWNSTLGTLAFGTGKYYFEGTRIGSGGSNTANIGITLSSKFGGNHSGVDAGRIMYSSNGYVYKDAWGLSNDNIVTIGSGVVIGVSLDTINGILKFYNNGSLVSTTTNNLLKSSNNEFIPACATYAGGKWRLNFGNGYAGTTPVSSAGTNASGNGIFEYDIQPTDATALSTKGLNL